MATTNKNTEYGYKGGGDPLSTQDRNEPIVGNRTEEVNPKLFVRTINRAPKDVGDWRSALIAAESVYYPNQSRLFDLYEDILLDAFLAGIIRKRISQVINKRLLFVRDGKEVPEMEKVIKSKVFKDIMREIIWTKMWGVNGLEFVPGDKLQFNRIPKKHIKRKTQLITYEQFGLTEGIDYTQLKNVWVLGEPHDLGLLLICGFLALLKKGNISDWAQYIELFGSPAIVVKYKGYDQQAKVAAEKVLDSVANSMRLTIPEEMNITFEDGKMANGDGKLQETFRQACNEELSIIMLGNTETTGHSKTGTGAKSQEHARQQLEIIRDDMDYVVDLLNSDHFMEILRSYNLPVDGGCFEFDREVDINLIQDKYKIDLAWLQAGLPMSKNYLYETYGIPEPESEEDTIKLSPQTPATEDEDEQDDKQKPAKKKAAAKKQPESLSAEDIKSMIEKSLSSFFGQAL
jgi:hypothetical protein